MIAMNTLGTVYATKRRRRNGKTLKPQPKDTAGKSNPSKRHRERLNAELDTLASLLPFDPNIISKLDKLSILRLSVAYLRTKSYFQVSMSKEEMGYHRTRDHLAYPDLHGMLDGEQFIQALNGFLFILDCDGEVFFATHSIENYLGFHQSDIVHQSVYELVHSEDREELQRQLTWSSFLPPEASNLRLHEVLQPDHVHLLERSFTVRFRCLLDNTSGFLRLDIRGRIKILHGQNRKSEEPPLALFALCTPFGPPSLLDVPQKDVMFKTKHKLDMALVSMDQRGKTLLGYGDDDLNSRGGYDLVHYDDLAYVANAHQELLKTGASGMICYRIQKKDASWQWLQTSSRLVYKNSKPDFVISTHRPLMEEEGRDLLGKRTMDFKISYLDSAFTSTSYTSDSELNMSPSSGPRMNRRYKAQLRDFLSSCRTKRRSPAEDYIAATPTYNNMYSYPCPTENGLYVQQNFQNFYPNIDNRLLSTDNLFQYRHLAAGASYYTDYAHPSAYMHGNGFLDMSTRPCITGYESQLAMKTATEPNKYYGCQLDMGGKTYCDAYAEPRNSSFPLQSIASYIRDSKNAEREVKHELSSVVSQGTYATNDTRQTVLMWGSTNLPNSVTTTTATTMSNTPTTVSTNNMQKVDQEERKYVVVADSPTPNTDPIKSLSAMNPAGGDPCKWGKPPKSTPSSPSPSSPEGRVPRVEVATPCTSSTLASYHSQPLSSEVIAGRAPYSPSQR